MAAAEAAHNAGVNKAQEVEEQWSLGSVGETGSGPHLTIGRTVEEAERAELNAAAGFIRTLAASSAYLPALDGIRELEARTQRLVERNAEARSQVELDALGAVFVQTTRLLIIAAELVVSEIDQFPISPEAASRARAAVAPLRDERRQSAAHRREVRGALR